MRLTTEAPHDDHPHLTSPARNNPVGGYMPRPLTEQERQEFLAEPHVAVLSVASDTDRPPLTVPLWYGYQPGGHLSFVTGTQGRKARKTRLIQKAGVLSLLVQRAVFPYKYVTVEGTVVRTDRPPSAVRRAHAHHSPPLSARRGSPGLRQSSIDGTAYWIQGDGRGQGGHHGRMRKDGGNGQ